MTKRTNTPPLRVNSAILAPFFQPGEPAVIVKLVGVGSTAPFEMRGGGTAGRSFIMEWNSRLDGHVVRIPLSLWMANDARMAHELMDHRRMAHAMVVTFEMPVPVAVPQGVMVSVEVSGNASALPVTATSTGSSDSVSDADVISEPAPNMGAAAYNVDASIVVGRGNVPPPAAPTLARAHGTGAGPVSATVSSPALVPGLAAAPTNEAVTPGDVAVPMLGGRPLHEAAHEKLVKPQRVKALAALLKVNEATLREAVGASGGRIEIAGPWVRRRVGVS